MTVEGDRAGQGGDRGGLGGDGGGVASFGPLTIVDSILRGNRAGEGGAGAGGLQGGAGGPAGLGGGLYVNGGPARVLASTFLRNFAYKITPETGKLTLSKVATPGAERPAARPVKPR